MKRLFRFLIVLIIIAVQTPLILAEALQIDASNYVLIDSKSGRVLAEKNPDERIYPASTTKIMTALLAVEKGDMDQLMTASRDAVLDVGAGGSNIGIMPGEEIRLEDLLNALLVKSANETANIIAENLSPTRKDFVDLMNAKAKELGANNTNFVNTNGLYHPNHYSTSSDMAKIAKYAMSLPKFREIVSRNTYTMPATNKHPAPNWAVLPTTNKILKKTSNYFTMVNGVKTGYTAQAGNSLVSSAYNANGMELISVFMSMKTPGADKNVFNFSKELLEYGFRNYSTFRIIEYGQVMSTLPVVEAENNASLNLIAAASLESVLPIGQNLSNINRKDHLFSDTLKAPIHKGVILGYYEYELNGVPLGTVDIVAENSIAVKSIGEKAADKTLNLFSGPLWKKIFIGTVIMLIAFFLLRVSLRRISQRVHEKGQENE